MRNLKKILGGGLLAAALMASSALMPIVGEAEAATATSQMNVSMTITAGCTLNVTPVNFPSAWRLDANVDANVDANATITVNCVDTLPYGIRISAGSGSSATPANRAMSNGTDELTYSLYRDPARTLVWGDDVATEVTGTGADVDLIVYARVPAQTTPSVGDYTDVVDVTINY